MIVALLAIALMQDPGRSPAPAVGADQEPPVRCSRDGNTLEINACFALDLQQEEARMRDYLEAAEVRAGASDSEGDSQSLAWLEASQAAWAAYADIRCKGVFDQWKDGSIRTIMYLGCMIEATRARTHDIWSDHLTYADNTPPILPEPVKAVAAD